jgi:hypothetical protein
MRSAELDALKKWFSHYVGTFYSPREDIRENISLKEDHTRSVCRNIVRIAADEGLGEEDVLLAEAVALLHDVGRFPQYFRYGTFLDSASVNHGRLGAEVLEENDVLHGLSRAERKIVVDSVKYHNAFKVPGLKDRKAVLFVRLIRDADKLDIWDIMLRHYGSPPHLRSSSLTLGLPDTPHYSSEAVSLIREGRVVSLSRLGSLNDYKLMQLSWIYDLNFRGSFRLLAERDYLRKFAAELPNQNDIARALQALEEFVSSRLQ